MIPKVTSKERVNWWRQYRVAVDSGDYATALSTAKDSVTFYKQQGDLRHAGIWQRALSTILYFQAEYDDAARAACLSVRMLPDEYEKALSLLSAGLFQTHAGKYKSAFAYFNRAHRIAASYTDDLYLWSHLYGTRAVAYRRTGKIDKAILDWEGSAFLLRRHGQLWRAALVLNNIGFLLTLGGHLKEAEQRVLEAIELIEQDPHLHTEGVIFDSLGYLYTRLNQHGDAERFLKKSIKTFDSIGSKAQEGGSLLHLAELYLSMHRYESAVEIVNRVLDLAGDIKSDSLRAEARECYERVLLAQLTDSLSDRRQDYNWLYSNKPGRR